MNKIGIKKRYTFIVFIIILFTLTVKFLSNTIINNKFLKNYELESYVDSSNISKKLLIFNISQPYIAHFNYANSLYHEKDLENAIKEYNQALKKHPPKNKVCDIRVNLAYSIV